MRHTSEGSPSTTPSAPHKPHSKLPIAAAISTAIAATVGGQETNAEPLKFPNYMACLGLGYNNFEGRTLDLTLDSDAPLDTASIDWNQFLSSWSWNKGQVDEQSIEEQLVFDGTNYYGVYYFPGNNPGTKVGAGQVEHSSGYYFFQIPKTLVVNDCLSNCPETKENAFLDGGAVTIAKLPNGEPAYESIEGGYFGKPTYSHQLKRFKATLDSTGLMNGLTYVETQQLKDIFPWMGVDGVLGVEIFGEYMVGLGGLPPDYNDIYIAKKDSTTGQYVQTASAKQKKIMGFPGPSLQVLNGMYFTDYNGKKLISCETDNGESLLINLDNPTDQEVVPARFARIVDDEGRFLLGRAEGGGKNANSVFWKDYKTGQTTTIIDSTKYGITIVAFGGKWKNDKGEWMRVWADSNQAWILQGEDITKMQHVGGIGSNSLGVCIPMTPSYPILTPKPVDPGPEQEPDAGAKDSGETTGTGDGNIAEPETSNPEPDTLDAGSPDTAKPGDTGADTADTKDGETVADTTPKDAAADSSPASDATDTKDTSLPTDVAVADTNKSDTQSAPEETEPTEEPDAKSGSDDTNETTADTDAGGTPPINDTTQSVDTIQQQQGGTNGGCNIGERISPNSPLGLAILAAVAGAALTMSRKKETPRARIRREIEKVLGG